MSSISGVYDGGGNNEDADLDQSTAPEGVKPMEEDENEEEAAIKGGDEDSTFREFDEADVLLEENDAEHVAQHEDELIEDDYAQIDRERNAAPDDIEVAPDAGPATPTAQSPMGSPAESGSIPDDTPSQPGSLLSSPGRGDSPNPRKAVSRTASGALQPFERRFETRLSASPSPSPRAASPHFLSPHSRQISISSQFSQVSSQGESVDDDVPQAPWDVVKWTKLRKISSQAFSESGRRSFGRPTCLAVSALIAIGTSKGLILGFDYHQTLKIIIGPGTKATECGSVTSLAIAADYSTISSGHANGHIFTWEISRPSRPFLQIPPLDRDALKLSQHADGHLTDCAVLHLGFLGTRHTALVSADAGGMAFSHLATRGLGPVTRTIKTTRLLGRYPSSDLNAERNRKPSSVLAFSPLPLGNVEQATDGMGLTALLTPYLLVVVSTTPIAQTQFKTPRPKDIKPQSTLSGCLAWFPAVKLKYTSSDLEKDSSDTKLVYCWSNVLSVLDLKVTENEDAAKPPNLEFQHRSRWRAEEAIVAIQWVGRSVLGVLTISQRMLIVEDGSLQVTDSIDLLHRHIYHQDLFSQQLHSVVESLDNDDPSLHGVVADAFYMSFRVYKGRTFLLGYNDLSVGTLSNWADRLMALMEAGDHIAAIRLATEYYAGSANNITVGLPDEDASRHEMVKERLLAMIAASLNYTFSQHDDGRDTRLRELADVCFDACIIMQETEYLFSDVFEIFEEAGEESIFLKTLEPYVLDGDVKVLPPEIVKKLVSVFISEGQGSRLEELLCRLDPHSFDLDQITMLCRQHGLYDALIYVWTQGIGDFVTPLIDLLTLMKMLQDGGEDEIMENNPFFEAAMKAFPYLAYSLTGRRYPSGDIMDDYEAARAKVDLYAYVFSGKPTGWPQGSRKIFRTAKDSEHEPAFPYVVLLITFDAASFMSMLNEAFEDPFLNEADDDNLPNSKAQVNGLSSRHSYAMSRQHVISIMLDISRQKEFDAEQIIYLDMFIARSLPKYPGQLVLSGSLLVQVLYQLCEPPSQGLRDECQLSVEYLLSAFRPPDITALVHALTQARFFRVLKTVYKGEKMFAELLETYFYDPVDKDKIFDCIAYCFRPSTGASRKQLEAVKQSVMQHIGDLVDISVGITARTLATYTSDLLQPSVNALSDSYQQFVFLRALLEPALLPSNIGISSASPILEHEQLKYVEQYVQLMCKHDPTHVAEYINVLPTSDLRLDKVLPAMESSGVIDAAVILLTRDGMARDALDRLVSHLKTLQHGLVGLINAVSSSPDAEATSEAVDSLIQDIVKYTKVGIWLCTGQSAAIERRPRPRMNFAWEIKEDDLDLDEFLWLNLVDIVVQITQDTAAASELLEAQASNADEHAVSHDGIMSSLRSNVQQSFTALLGATATPSAKLREQQVVQQRSDNLSFLRVLRAFLTRASARAPTLLDLRAVLTDIFSAYAYEEDILSLAHDLLGSDVFADIQEANELRQRGWRPRSQVCEQCKRRAWGPGIGEIVWDEWVAKEQDREANKARRAVERGGGDDAKRLERGKAKADSTLSATSGTGIENDGRRLALVVFACRHVFHRTCLDRDYKDGKPPKQESYSCPLCTNET